MEHLAGGFGLSSFLREEVGSCFAISWYMQDGLHFGGMRRRMLARHSMYYDLEAADCEDDDGGGLLRREKDLCITWKCSSHVTSNAIKWALDTVTSEQVLDDLAIGILSLINSSEDIFKKVDEFVITGSFGTSLQRAERLALHSGGGWGCQSSCSQPSWR